MIQYMHRRFGGKVYRLYTRVAGKPQAQRSVEWWRENGWLAQAVKLTGEWDGRYAIYIAPKIKEFITNEIQLGT